MSFKILFEQSAETLLLSTRQLIETLEKKYGISAHRVTIYEDMEQLRAFGFDVYTVKSTQIFSWVFGFDGKNQNRRAGKCEE